MKFSDKIRALRKHQNLTQQELAKKLNVTLRTVANYESGVSYPKKRDMYKELADALKVNTNYLLTEDEEFILQAKEQYGSGSARQAKILISELTALFSGGKLDEEDKDEMMKAIQEAYWISKKKTTNKKSKNNKNKK